MTLRPLLNNGEVHYTKELCIAASDDIIRLTDSRCSSDVELLPLYSRPSEHFLP